MKHLLIYVSKLWLTACIIGPLCWWMTESISTYINTDSFQWHWITDGLFFYLILFPVLGAIFSFPCVTVLFITVYLTRRYTKLQAVASRILWSVIGIGLSILPFYLLSDLIWGGDGWGPAPYAYAAVIVAGIWIYRFKPASGDDDYKKERLNLLAINP